MGNSFPYDRFEESRAGGKNGGRYGTQRRVNRNLFHPKRIFSLCLLRLDPESRFIFRSAVALWIGRA